MTGLSAVLMHNEDLVRKILRTGNARSAALFSGTSHANRALALEEALWEALFVQAGLRFRPLDWAAHAAEAEDDELEPSSCFE